MPNRPDRHTTRDALIGAGLHLFGRKGYEGTSIRELAARADTNVASIGYHFGGKPGLRAACADFVASRIGAALDATGAPDGPPSPEAAARQIEQLITAFVGLVVGTPQAQDMVAFMLRELAEPGAVADRIYTDFVAPRHRTLCALLATAIGARPEDEHVKLAVFALIGQVVYFRIASAFVMRRMRWDAIGPAETRKIADAILANFRETVERYRS